MPKPIFKIDDFSSWISYDETESILNGFNDLSNIDIKTTLGVAQLSKSFSNYWTTTFTPTNKLIEYTFLPDILSNNTTGAFVLSREWWPNARIYAIDTATKAISLFYSSWSWTGCPLYSDMAIFNNRLFYPNDKTEIRSIWLWTTWKDYAISTDWTANVQIVSPNNFKLQPLDQSLVWWQLYVYYPWSWYSNYTITAIVWQQITCSSTVPTTWAYKWYIINTITWVKNSSWITTTLPTANKTTKYRPMIDFNSKLYVWDWDMIYSLDSTMTNWKVNNWDWAISVWTDYIVKQFEQIGWYMYILADKYNENYYNDFNSITWQSNSKLFIRDWTSAWFSNIINIWSHCYWIKVAENRIYAVLQSSVLDWVLFTYFNGSDFPTIAKFKIDNPNCPVNCITYDRWRFFVAVNWYTWTTLMQATIFSYNANAVETPTVSKEYEVLLWPYWNNSYQLYWLDYLREATTPLMLYFDWRYSDDGTAIKYRNNSLFTSQWTIQTQKYEITPNQFWVLAKWVQLNFKEIMNSNCSVEVWYKWDESSTFIKLWTLTSTNQNEVLYWINERFKKIQFNIILKTSDSTYTPKIVKISIY